MSPNNPVQPMHYSAFSPPTRQIVLMLTTSALIAFGIYLIAPNVAPVFYSNVYLNSVIFVVFLIGILACFWQIVQLLLSVHWIRDFINAENEQKTNHPPRLLTPLATLLRHQRGEMQISTTSSRTILDSVGMRIDEIREITRYIINVLIYLGLLGTFYGLATTVPSLIDTIRNLNPQATDTGIAIFSQLMSGLETQLDGMGTAFATSLLGLAGSLVVGILELFAGQGQNRFYRELEEWLSTITHVDLTEDDNTLPTAAAGNPRSASAVPYIVNQLKETKNAINTLVQVQTKNEERMATIAQSLDALTRILHDQKAAQTPSSQEVLQYIGQADTNNEARINALAQLIAETSTRIGDQNTHALQQIVHTIEHMIHALHEQQQNGVSLDKESRTHLHNIDAVLSQMLEQIRLVLHGDSNQPPPQ